MRSRYSAFAVGNVEYLLATHHPSQQQPNPRAGLLQTVSRTNWIGLQILATRQGAENDTSGWVEFVAAYEEGGVTGRLHERSEFVRENGRWFYLSGDAKNLAPPKLGRNQPCWCGSGKKYKKCHMRKSPTGSRQLPATSR